MNLKERLIDLVSSQYPALSNETIRPLISENLFSPFIITLPKKILKQAEAFINSTYKLRNSEKYLDFYKTDLEKLNISDPLNKSIMMSFDFHVDNSEILKLIEINTNAAFLGMGDLMYKVHGIDNPCAQFKIESLKNCIETELKLNGQDSKNPVVSIIDENPSTQRLYIEFLVFNELFKKFGWSSEISDYRSINPKSNFIYNRFTDFYLTKEESSELRTRFINSEICLSPNPFEYFLLADKQRMIDWNTNTDFIKSILSEDEFQTFRNHIPHCSDLTPESADQIWSHRKNLFIKPKRAYGSKQSYKAASMSRKLFNELLTEDMIAQEYIPAPEQTFQTSQGEENFKFDLRFITYTNELQIVVARIYQGQVTNLKTPMGGFACVKFI